MLCCVKTLQSQSIQVYKWYDSAAVEDSVFMWFDVHPKLAQTGPGLVLKILC